MTPTTRLLRNILVATLFAGSSLASPMAFSQISATGTSEYVSWDCVGTDCPWGSPLFGEAIAWPAEAQALNARLGYATSAPVYLPAAQANGAIIWVDSGLASVYVGTPDAPSHTWLADIAAGDFYVVEGLTQGEVMSVQAGNMFSYQIDLPPPAEPEVPDPTPPDPSAELVTWQCTGGDCPWGASVLGYATIWPTEGNAGTARRGYTTSEPVYLPDGFANGAVITVTSGTASILAGGPFDTSHRLIGTLLEGDSITVSGLAIGEVLSVQADQPFDYTVTLGDPALNGGNTTAPMGDDPDNPDPDPETDPPVGTALSAMNVTWSCTDADCPWGSPLSGFATVWPADQNPGDVRRGYTTSEGVYLPDGYANDAVVTVTSGFASLYAGNPSDSSHRLIASLYAGETIVVTGLALGEVLSIQDAYAFEVVVTFGDPTTNGGSSEAPVRPEPDPDPEIDPGSGVVYHSVESNWRCNTPGCSAPDWQASVIDFPPWSAYSSNNRTGDNSRTTYADDGRLLYPYMGEWAHGCEVLVLSGTVLLIEWERGADVWRETLVYPGQTHTINLIGNEDNALIETPSGRGAEFSVALSNCEPQSLP